VIRDLAMRPGHPIRGGYFPLVLSRNSQAMGHTLVPEGMPDDRRMKLEQILAPYMDELIAVGGMQPCQETEATRSKVVSVYCTPGEYRQLQENAQGASLSSFLRDRALLPVPQANLPIVPSELRELYLGLGRVSAILNQQTDHLSSLATQESPPEMQESLQTSLAQLDEALQLITQLQQSIIPVDPDLDI